MVPSEASLPGSYPGSYKHQQNNTSTTDKIFEISGLPGSYPGSYQSQQKKSSQTLSKEVYKPSKHTKEYSFKTASSGKYSTSI